MAERRYPNETQAYRDAREALLKDEQKLVAKTKAVAEKRRKLPLGDELSDLIEQGSPHSAAWRFVDVALLPSSSRKYAPV
jgi:hypothetical protein